MALRACPSCARHVRVADSVCPFCSAAQPPAPAPRATTTSSIGTRAALLFGATAVATACQTSAVALYGAPYEPTEDAGADAEQDGGTVVALYGAPGPDASFTDGGADAASDAQADAPTSDVGPVPAYGAPGPDQ